MLEIRISIDGELVRMNSLLRSYSPVRKKSKRTLFSLEAQISLPTGRPIIFAFGKDSMFAKRAAQEAGSIVVDSDSAEELANAVMQVKDKGTECCNSGPFFIKNFARSKNSGRYAEIITETGVAK